MKALNNPMYRPPAEAESLILQVDEGCPHNRCTFCGMYRRTPYRQRDLDTVRRMLEALSSSERQSSRIFLADGDVMVRSFEALRDLLLMLNVTFPALTRVSLYANGSSIAAKTDEQLRTLRGLKLHTLYLGMESGDDTVLEACRKGENADDMVGAAVRAQAAGLRISVMVLLGLGGRARSVEHARRTAAALNRMQPRLFSALRVVPVEGTPLYDMAREGRFKVLSEREIVLELREMIAMLELRKCVFRANHGSNVIPLEGRFPQDRDRLLYTLDTLLATDMLDHRPPAILPGPQYL